MSHDPSKWGDKVWQYFPINYPLDLYFKNTEWWLGKIPELGDSILEVGCHTGLGVLWLSKKFPEKFVVGADINERVVHMARTRCFYWKSDIAILVGDGFNLELDDKSFDVIYHEGLVEHFDELSRVHLLEEHLRVAKKVLFVVPTKKNLEQGGGYGDEYKLSYGEWSGFIKRYFKVVEEFGNEMEYGCIIEEVIK